MTELGVALKEWAIAVEALLAGELILLLRKGGIGDRGGQFQLQAERALLFPTREHQRPHLLKAPWGDRCPPVPAAPPTTLTFQGWGQITHRLSLPDAAQVERLTPFHLWTPQWVEERMAWHPQRPVQALLLRVHRLPHPVTYPYQASYGGCRSWLTLPTPVPLTGSEPVLTEQAYGERVTALLNALGLSAAGTDLGEQAIPHQ